MHPGRDPDRLAAARRRAEVDRLHQGARPVIERGVGHRQPGQTGHHGLELEDGLQHALGHLGLVRRVRGHELRAPRQGPDHRGHLVVVGSTTGEAHHPVGSGPVGAGPVFHPGQHIGLGRPVGHGQAAGHPQNGRHRVEELVDAPEPEEAQHGRHLVVGVWQVVAHLAPPAVVEPDAPVARGGQKGVGTTVAPSARPRTATATADPSPTPAAVSTRAKAMPRSSMGEKFPLVTVPTVLVPTATLDPWRGGWRPSARRPRRSRRGPSARSASRAARPQNSPLSHPTTQARLAWRGVIPGPNSWPCRGSPASSRRVSRAPRPAGTAPVPSTASKKAPAASAGTAHSTPSSPVYPVPAARHPSPFHSKAVTANRRTVAASGATASRRRRASGPCTATIARSAVVSRPPMAATTRAVFEALGITSKRSSATHHTMMSSVTEPSSASRWVYWARPGPILRRSLVKVCCKRSKASGPPTRTVPRWLTSKATAAVRHARCSATVPPG